MAPEVVKSNNYCRFSDIWSLGCTIIEMATGKPPHSSVNPTTAMLHIVDNKQGPAIPDFLSDKAKDFIKRCLQYEPHKRDNVFKLLRHEWLAEIFNDD